MSYRVRVYGVRAIPVIEAKFQTIKEAKAWLFDESGGVNALIEQHTGRVVGVYHFFAKQWEWRPITLFRFHAWNRKQQRILEKEAKELCS